MRDFKYTYHAKNVDSTAISDLWFARDMITGFGDVIVKYRDTGALAGWSNVPAAVVDRVMSSASIGRDLNRLIKQNANYPGFNTSLVNFVDNRQGAQVRPFAAARNGFIVSDPAVVNPKQSFNVSGVVLKPTGVTDIVEANSLEEAMRIFKDKHGDNLEKITGVTERVAGATFR